MDENPYRAPQKKPQPTGRKQRRPSRSDFVIATLLVFLGIAGWFFGLGFGLAGAAWGEYAFFVGPFIGAAGVLRLLYLAYRL